MDLHIFFLPFLAPGHMIPMVDLAKLFTSRGVKATVVTTTGNASLVQPTIDCSPHPINLLTLPFPSSTPENVTHLPTPELTPDFIVGLESLKSSFEQLLIEHQPDCIVSDIFYPWSADLAVEHNIPRVTFHGSSSFAGTIAGALRRFNPHESAASDDEPFVIPGLPHRIEMCRSQLIDGMVTPPNELTMQMIEANKKNYGTVMNTFYDMEPGYTEDFMAGKTWLIGPVYLCNGDTQDKKVRGGGSCSSSEEQRVDDCLNWLNNKDPGSVLYVCFGSLGQFTTSQLCEIATGLNSCGHPFVWVVKNVDDTSEWMPEGIEEKGFITKGWAPQMVILNHPAVGGFLTHCGWNSCIEGASSGVPMITWPLFAEQFFNERLLVDVLRIGVVVGSKVCSPLVEKRTTVSGEKVKEAIEEVMGSGEQKEERRKRAKEVSAKAKISVEEGGSSYNNMNSMIQELMEIKASKSESGN